jgi:hypothetical protein
VGQFISAVGDQFYLVAIPWLALQMTGRAFVAGTVLAVAGIPRALAMLLGGAASDRFSAKMLLVGSNGIQGVFVFILGLVVLLPGLPLWPLFVLAFAIGTVDAFGLPAINTLLPELVEDRNLEGGNVYLQGTNILSSAIGPAIAGILISLTVVSGDGSANLQGIGIAFLVNAAAFWVGISFFAAIRSQGRPPADPDENGSLMASLPAIHEYITSDIRLVYMMVLMLTLGLFLEGTIRVGFALLANAQLTGSIQDLGNMTSAFGIGVLAGMIGRRVLPKPPARISGLVVLALFSAVPFGLILLGLIRNIVPILVVVLLMGLSVGYIMIYLLSWLQLKTPRHLLGKVMAAVFFSTIGLAPLSQILMGYLLDINLTLTFIGAGVLVLVILLVTLANRRMWSLEMNGVSNEPPPA